MQEKRNSRIIVYDAHKGFWLAIVFCVLMLGANGQNWKIKAPDTLLQAVKNSRGHNKVDALNRLAHQTILFSTSEAIAIVQQAYQLSITLHYHKGEADAFENHALLVFRRGEFNTAINLINKAALIYEAYNYREEFIKCLIIEASYYGFINDNGEITDTYVKAIKFSQQFKRLDLEAEAETSFGQYLLRTGDLINSKKYLLKAVADSKQSNNLLAMEHAIYGIALFYSSEKQNTKAIHYLRISLDKASAAKDNIGKMTIFSSIGTMFTNNNEYDSSFVYYNKAIKLAASLNDAGMLATTSTLLAHLFQLEQQPDSALKYQMNALNLRLKQGNMTLISSSLTNIGTVYAQKHNYIKADSYFNKGLALAKQTGYLKYIQNNYQHLCDLYVAQKNYRKAIDYNLLLRGINDSILNNATRQKVSSIQARYESEQKQKDIEFLTKENDIQQLKINQTRFMIYILGTLLILLIVIGVLLDIHAKLNARHFQMENEQKLLRSQMNPHFIFNALVSIQGFIYNNESEVAAKYLTRFARLIRLVLSNSRSEFVTLQREIDMLENYLALQKMRFDNKFNYMINVDPDLDPEFINIPPMLAQPFLENAIEQGLLGMDKPGYIEISILERNHNILIQVEDNGTMREINLQKFTKSDDSYKADALRITRERIRQLNQKHSLKIIFSTNELKDENNQFTGTIAMLVIPEKRMEPVPSLR